MVDTPRTIADLQALFADNSSGNISAQDLRDFLVTVVNYLDAVVMAPEDPDAVPLTIEGVADHTGTLLQINEPDDGTNYQDILIITSEGSGGVELLKLDSAGQLAINTLDVGACALAIVPKIGAEAFGAHLVVVAAESTGTLLDIEADGQFSVGNAALPKGLRLLGPHAAPADGSLNTGDLALWFDQTNGAAKLMLKGKSENGTVVTGQVALS